MTGTRIVAIRHGETDWSASGRHTSRTDLSLNDEGRERAGALEEVLRGRDFALVLCSPLRRARETCELAGYGDRAVLCEDLHEWDYGQYEGLTTAEISERNPHWNLWRDGCPDGEGPNDVAVRVDRVLERALATDAEVLVFSHGHTLRTMAARWIEMGFAAGARFALGAGAVGVLGYERRTRVLTRWNAAAP
jgi:broad specificity phosphatase PhoE